MTLSQSLRDFIADRAERLVVEESLPGLVCGIFAANELVHVVASGETRLGGGELPTIDSVFRIASMTKSFTAAAILLLRDRGALALDDPIATHLPWTREIGAPPGSAPITVRDLLTMNAGFPTDDPWGDRLEPQPVAEFDALVASGLSFVRAPGTTFTYANLGYALLGRIVAAASGAAYTDFVTREVLAPLGMHATCFDTRDVLEARRAHGYARFASGLVAEPPVGTGAFSPMGGLHSSVRDLAVWVRGFIECADDSLAHPVRAASRREMQAGRTHVETELVAASDDTRAIARTKLYGYGLNIDVDSHLGTFVHHSGGYPGFGSHMRWHPASGLAIVALGNRTYAPMRSFATTVLAETVAEMPLQTDVLATLWPATRAAMDVVEGLARAWDDALADAHFASNVDLDRPRDERRAELARIVAELGPFARIERSVTSQTPADAMWRVRGPHGEASFELLMTPERPPRIQLVACEKIATGA